jgi:uncharacterized membrane-anchored protein
MTDQERQLLQDTAENLLRLLRQWDDTIEGMTVAITELFRSDITTPERKLATLARLKLQLDVMRQKGKGVKYLTTLIGELDKWAGYQAQNTHPEH